MLNLRHKKILLLALLAIIFTPVSCFAQMGMAPPMFGLNQGLMNSNNERFLPAGIEAPEPVVIPKKTKIKKSKDPEQAEQKPVQMISDHMDYFHDEDKIVATGNAVVISDDGQSKLKADKITLYRDTNEMVAEGNVRVLKNNSIVYGSFMRVDLNKNTGFITNPKMGNSLIKIVAREGYVYSKDMEFLKGHAKFADGISKVVGTTGIYTGFEDLDQRRMAMLPNSPKYRAEHNQNSYKIKAKEIIVDSGQERNMVIMKGATIYKNKKKIGSMAKFITAGESNMGAMETNLPEFGYLRQMGAYIGPGFLFDGPNNSTIKLSPLLMYDSSGETGNTGSGGMGVGGLGTFRTATNMTDLGYGTPRKMWVLKGKQELFDDPRFTFNYASNAFIDDWFMGGKMPNRFAEVAFRDSTKLDDLGLVYRYKYSGAVASDYQVGNAGDWRMNSTAAEQKLPTHDQGWSTLKFKTQGELTRQKPIWQIKDKAMLNVAGQYDINQYGTGQTYSLVRIGPNITWTPTSKFRMRAAYFMSGQQGESPFAWDQYYLGKQSVTGAYEYQLTRKLAIGASQSVNILKDSFDGRFLVENKLFFKYGPDDFKFCFTYDTVWRRTAVGVNMLVGSDNSDIEFDKLKVKNYKKLQLQQEQDKVEKENKKKKEEQV